MGMTERSLGWVDVVEFDHAREFLMYLIEAIALDASEHARRGLMCRGQRDEGWHLVPGSRRIDAMKLYGLDPMAHITRQEEELIRRFVRAADAHGLHVPGGAADLLHLDPPKDPVEQPLSWLTSDLEPVTCLAQHFGIPTPILDWSREPLVAAYFAAHDAVTKGDVSGRLAVWIIDQWKLEWASAILNRGRGSSRQGEGWGEDQMQPWLRIVQVPRAGNSNLDAQAGLATLMLPPHDVVGLDQLIESKYTKLSANPYGEDEKNRRVGLLRKITLPKAEAPRLLRELLRLGVSRASLFPGYASLALLLQEEATARDAVAGRGGGSSP